jgi:hypothetical protein
MTKKRRHSDLKITNPAPLMGGLFVTSRGVLPCGLADGLMFKAVYLNDHHGENSGVEFKRDGIRPAQMHHDITKPVKSGKCKAG